MGTIIAIIGATIFAVLSALFEPKDSPLPFIENGSKTWTGISLLFFVLFMVTLFSSFFVDWTGDDEVIVAFDENEQVTSINTIGSWCPPWNDRCLDVSTLPQAVFFKAKMTENGEACQDIIFTIEAEITNMHKFFKAHPYIFAKEDDEKPGSAQHIVTAVEYWLYDFSALKATELAKLNNPHDKKQQAALETLLRDHLDTPLEKLGLRMVKLRRFGFM